MAATAALAAAKGPTFLGAADARTGTASAPGCELLAAFAALALALALVAERLGCEVAARAGTSSVRCFFAARSFFAEAGAAGVSPARGGVASVRCFLATGSTAAAAAAAARRTPLGVPAAATPPPSTSALRRVLGGEPFFGAPPSLGSGAGDAAGSARFGARRSASALLKVAGSLATRTVGETRGVPLGGVMLLHAVLDRCCFGRLALNRLGVFERRFIERTAQTLRARGGFYSLRL